VTGVGRVELFDPEVLAAKAQEIGRKKLARWTMRPPSMFTIR